jgi:DnaJ-class molecular chaperone
MPAFGFSSDDVKRLHAGEPYDPAAHAFVPEDTDAGCPKCGSDDTEWETCHLCFGEGEFDMHEEDGVNYAPGEEFETCEECGGEGGYLVCHECQRRAKAEVAAD